MFTCNHNRWWSAYWKGTFSKSFNDVLDSDSTTTTINTNKQSTLSENIAKRFSGSCWSVGETLRDEARRRDISIAEMCNLAKQDLSIDLGVDMEMCRKICEGNSDGSPLIAQGRLPAVLATASQEFLGKPQDSIFRIYLKCSILEQTLRFMLS